MPLTPHEREVKDHMTSFYTKHGKSAKEAEAIFYAWENKHRRKKGRGTRKR